MIHYTGGDLDLSLMQLPCDCQEDLVSEFKAGIGIHHLQC